jgi:hypothetical protein
MLARVINALAVAAFACLVLGFGFVEWNMSSHPSKTPSQQRAANYTTNKVSKDGNEKSIWKPNDPISAYTFVLAIFTGLLVVVSGIQIRFLIKADNTARISADAATVAANATKEATALAREEFRTTFRARIAFLSAEINRDDVGNLRISFSLENTGQLPATKLSIYYTTSVSIKEMENIPPDRSDITVNTIRQLGDRVLAKKEIYRQESLTKDFDPRAYENVLIGYSSVRVGITIAYVDGFDNERTTAKWFEWSERLGYSERHSSQD